MHDSPDSPGRVQHFAAYFKNYMGVATVIVAALPIPVTSFALIPTFAAQRNILSVYVSLFCFLAFAYVFYVRHPLARLMFAPRPWYALIPLIAIACSVTCLALYHELLNDRVREAKVIAVNGQRPIPSTAQVLADTSLDEISRSGALMFAYLGLFLFAELAFVLMATREYMQDVLAIDDSTLLRPLGQSVAIGYQLDD